MPPSGASDRPVEARGSSSFEVSPSNGGRASARGNIDELIGGLLLGLVLWIGFPFVLWLRRDHLGSLARSLP